VVEYFSLINILKIIAQLTKLYYKNGKYTECMDGEKPNWEKYTRKKGLSLKRGGILVWKMKNGNS